MTEKDASSVHYMKTQGIQVKARRKGSLESYRMMFLDTTDYIGGIDPYEVEPKRISIQLYPKGENEII